MILEYLAPLLFVIINSSNRDDSYHCDSSAIENMQTVDGIMKQYYADRPQQQWARATPLLGLMSAAPMKGSDK